MKSMGIQQACCVFRWVNFSGPYWEDFSYIIWSWPHIPYFRIINEILTEISISVLDRNNSIVDITISSWIFNEISGWYPSSWAQNQLQLGIFNQVAGWILDTSAISLRIVMVRRINPVAPNFVVCSLRKCPESCWIIVKRLGCHIHHSHPLHGMVYLPA